MSERCDVAVVGGGLAGLSLASRLFEAGADVRVIEARERLGGRTLTRHVDGVALDLGGQWIGPTQGRMIELCERLGVKTFRQHAEGDKVLDHGGRKKRYRGRIPSLSLSGLLAAEVGLRRLDSMARRVPLDAPSRAADAGFWDGITVEGFARRYLPQRDARAVFDVAVRTVFGVEPSELSLLYFLFYLNSGTGFRALTEVEGGAQQLRLAGGVQQLCERLGRELGDRVELGRPVRRLEQGGDEVVIHGNGRRLAARYVVVAVPPHLAARIEYDPLLPDARDQVLQRWAMGAAVKAVAVYDRDHWRREGLSGEAVCTAGPVSCVFDASSPDGSTPALVAFVMGRHARALSRKPESERRALVAGELERLLGAPAASVVAYVEQDWTAERWSGGGPVATLPTGALTTSGDAWRAPTGRIHWAGTERARHWNGYLEGALESAERVGSEVLGRL